MLLHCHYFGLRLFSSLQPSWQTLRTKIERKFDHRTREERKERQVSSGCSFPSDAAMKLPVHREKGTAAQGKDLGKKNNILASLIGLPKRNTVFCFEY